MIKKLLSQMVNERDKSAFAVKTRTSASVIALASMGVIAPSVAQDEQEIEGALVEEVIVTGLRGSILSAQAIKRDAEQSVDSVTASDIGALPDRSVSEALQRIPGVQLQRTNANRDPARLAAEGGGVFVRGLSWVRTELNGRDIFSADSGRSLGFEDVSADLLAGVDVFKSPTAGQIEGGIGGTVNLRTRKPFDQDGMLAAGSIDYNYADMLEEGFTSVSGIFSNRWDMGEGEAGFLISASHSEIGNRTDSIQTGRFQPTDNTDYHVPNVLGWRRIDWEQERSAVSTAFQFAPNEKLELTLEAVYAKATPEDHERAASVAGPWASDLNANSGSDFTYDANGMLQTGTVDNASIGFNHRYGKRDSSTGDYSIAFKYFPSENWAVSGDFQIVRSRADVLSMTVYTQPGAAVDGDVPALNYSGGDVVFDLRGSSPSLSVSNREDFFLKERYWWAAAMDHIEDNNADSKAARLDAEYTFDDDSFLNSFRFGARATERDAITRQSGWNWAFLSNQHWGGGTPAYLDEYETDQTHLYTFDDFRRGEGAPSPGWFANEGLVQDPISAYEHLRATQTSGWGWSPLQAPEAYDLNPQGDNVSAGINDQTEKTQAIYATLRFGNDVIDGNIGVRVVETETTALGRNGAGGLSDDCNDQSADCTNAATFITAYNDAEARYRNYTNSYTNVLPSFNLRYSLMDDLQFRVGLSRSMVRPGFHQIRPSTVFTFDFEGNAFDPNRTVGVGTVNEGSPYLKPTVSDNLDLSAEWYFDDTASLTLALFYKDISDYILLSTSRETYTYGGQTYDFEANRQINGESGTVQGFEIAYQQFFDFLPGPLSGLGVQSNYTYIENEGGANTAFNIFEDAQRDGVGDETLPIEGMSKTSYNLALLYEYNIVSARLAYNWRERYLLTTSAANLNRPVWFDDYGQLDGSIFFDVTENFKLGLQGTNLLAEQTELQVLSSKPGVTPTYSWTDTDRRIAVVARYKF